MIGVRSRVRFAPWSSKLFSLSILDALSETSSQIISPGLEHTTQSLHSISFNWFNVKLNLWRFVKRFEMFIKRILFFTIRSFILHTPPYFWDEWDDHPNNITTSPQNLRAYTPHGLYMCSVYCLSNSKPILLVCLSVLMRKNWITLVLWSQSITQ